MKMISTNARLEPDVSLAMHEIIRDTGSSEEVNKCMSVHGWKRLKDHYGVRKKDDSNADEVEDQVLLHCIYIHDILDGVQLDINSP